MMQNNVARGKNFEVGPNEAWIFHASARRTDEGRWRYKELSLENDAFEHGAREKDLVLSIQTYLDFIYKSGEGSRIEMGIMSPIVALALHAEGVIKAEHFQEADEERSSAYFDLPGAEKIGRFVLRVAQSPSRLFVATDRRGYPFASNDFAPAHLIKSFEQD